MVYYEYHFLGMHLLWWFFWILLLFMLFGWFDTVPKKQIRKDSPLDILQKRFASGEITVEEYEERKNILEANLGKKES
jgi:putative membrane protein